MTEGKRGGRLIGMDVLMKTTLGNVLPRKNSRSPEMMRRRPPKNQLTPL